VSLALRKENRVESYRIGSNLGKEFTTTPQFRYLKCISSNKTLVIVFISTEFMNIWNTIRSRHRVVIIATGYRLDDRGIGVRIPVESRIFSSPRRPDRLWGPPSILPNGYRKFFPRR
jgi:hypothetical protein